MPQEEEMNLKNSRRVSIVIMSLAIFASTVAYTPGKLGTGENWGQDGTFTNLHSWKNWGTFRLSPVS
jgi:hypothetical protein